MVNEKIDRKAIVVMEGGEVKSSGAMTAGWVITGTAEVVYSGRWLARRPLGLLFEGFPSQSRLQVFPP